MKWLKRILDLTGYAKSYVKSHWAVYSDKNGWGSSYKELFNFELLETTWANFKKTIR